MANNTEDNEFNPIDEVMTVAEAARYHDVSTRAIEYQCQQYWFEEGEARRANGTILINKRRVKRFVPQKKG